MKKKNIHYLPNELEEYIIRKEQRQKIEQEALEKLTEIEMEILKLRFGFEGETQLTYDKCEEILHINTASIRQKEKKALKKLRIIILKHKNEIIDSETGMTLMHLDLLAQNITHDMYFDIYSKVTNRNLIDNEKWKMIEQWCKKVILQKLSTTERKQLLDYFIFTMRVKKETKEEQNYIKQKFVQKFLFELNKDQLFCEKVKVKVRKKNSF